MKNSQKYSLQSYQSGNAHAQWIVSILCLLLIFSIIYLGHLCISCYRYSAYVHTVRSLVDAETKINEVLTNPTVKSYIGSSNRVAKLAIEVQSCINKQDWNGARELLSRHLSNDPSMSKQLEDAYKELEASSAELDKLTREWKDLILRNENEAARYVSLQKDLSQLLAFSPTQDFLPPKLIIEQLEHSARFSFYEEGSLKDLPVIVGIPDNMNKSAMVQFLAAGYKAYMERAKTGIITDKETQPQDKYDPAAAFRRVQALSQQLRLQNDATTSELVKNLDTRRRAEYSKGNSLSSINGIMSESLLQQYTPHIPNFIVDLYSWVRFHARKFGYQLPEAVKNT